MKYLVRTSCVALALGCAAILLPAASQAVEKEKDKVFEVKGELVIKGALADTDPFDKLLKKSYCKVYLVKMTAGKTYVIRMNADDMMVIDAFLRVEDSAGNQLAFNDDAPGEMTLNSRIDFVAPKDDIYRVYATSLFGPRTGGFTVIIKE